MSYIGNTSTVQQYAPQVAYFSGNASTTAFTLPVSVVSAAQIIVAVANVIQNPSSAFTVSGTTLTFTSAPPTGTNNIWVQYTALQTNIVQASPASVGLTQLSATGTPSVSNYLRGDNSWASLTSSQWTTTGSNISYTAGGVGVGVAGSSGTPLTIGRVDSSSEGGQIDLCRSSDNSSIWGIDVYGNTSTPSLRILDNGAAAVRLQIDGSGRVTKPYQPYFYAYSSGNFSSGQNAEITAYNTALSNVGSCYSTSTGRFTAPVAGIYIFFHRLSTTAQVSYECKLFLNGSTELSRNYVSQPATAASTGNASVIVSLSAGDYVTAGMYVGTSQTWLGTDRALSAFYGYLL
jgi:hypothetical protein